MNAFTSQINNILAGLRKAIARFPFAVVSFAGVTGLACYMVANGSLPGLIIEKLMFLFIFSSFLGIAAQFFYESFPSTPKRRAAYYGVAAIFTLLYYLLIQGAPAIDYGVGARTSVAVFALFCAFLWLPSFRTEVEFESVALIHFKAALTSLLYATVLAMGLAALIAAFDLLLFSLDSDIYGYMLAIVMFFFAPVYYLSLLPAFNSQESEAISFYNEARQYPGILRILVTRIAIPLLAAYTLVLFAYFAKIGITGKWPVGQLGPMILVYGSVGLILYVLAVGLEEGSASLYRRFFPKALVPIAAMQLVSVFIRLRAYGFTESRYYVALFGVFALVTGLIFSFSATALRRTGLIALLAAGFAIFSVIPPADAFGISRRSQINRLENMLQASGQLVNGQLKADSDASEELRRETTSILYYLQQRGYTERVSWLPAGFSVYQDMEQVFGFDDREIPNGRRYYSVALDREEVLPLTGYDLMLTPETYNMPSGKNYPFTLGDEDYNLRLQRTRVQGTEDIHIALQDAGGNELLSSGLLDLARQLKDAGSPRDDLKPLADLAFLLENEEYRLQIIVRNISFGVVGNDVDYIEADFFALIRVKNN